MFLMLFTAVLSNTHCSLDELLTLECPAFSSTLLLGGSVVAM